MPLLGDIMRVGFRTLFVSAALIASGCASAPATSTAPAASTVAASTPSPRAECAPAQVTLYFGSEIASDEPVVTPLLNDFMEHIRRCETAGGELRSITIVASADPDQSPAATRAQVERRQARVRAALVHAGAPANKIVDGPPMRADAVMGRRAEITAALY